MIQFRNPPDKHNDAWEALNPVLPSLSHVGHLDSGDGNAVQIIVDGLEGGEASQGGLVSSVI